MIVISHFVFAFFPLTAWAEPNAAELLSRAVDYDATQASVRDQYVYHEHVEHRRAGMDAKSGKLNFTQDYEWMVAGGGPFRKLVQINGKPLDRKSAKEQVERMSKSAAERRAEAKANPRKFGLCFPCFDDGDVLRVMELRVIHEEEVNGRKAWVIETRKPLDGANVSLAIHFKTTYWIDEQDAVIARARYEQVTDGGTNKPGSWQEASRVRLPDGTWFEQRIEIKGHTEKYWFQTHTFSNVRKFGAESTVLFIEQK